MPPTYLPPQITTHEADALKRLLTQYSADRAPVLRAIISTHADRWQEVENAFYQLLTLRSLSSAFGAQLDVIGKLVGQPRNGNDDPTFLSFIILRIAEINSFGTSEELISIFRSLFGGPTIFLDEFFPAKFQLTALGGSPIVPVGNIINVIQECKAAGVGIVGLIWSPDLGTPFVFADDPSGLGFGYTLAGEDEPLGGSFAGAL